MYYFFLSSDLRRLSAACLEDARKPLNFDPINILILQCWRTQYRLQGTDATQRGFGVQKARVFTHIFRFIPFFCFYSFIFLVS